MTVTNADPKCLGQCSGNLAARLPWSEKPHLHRIEGGDTAALFALISSLAGPYMGWGYLFRILPGSRTRISTRSLASISELEILFVVRHSLIASETARLHLNNSLVWRVCGIKPLMGACAPQMAEVENTRVLASSNL